MPQRHQGFHEYCGAQDPNRVRPGASCVLLKGHSSTTPHKDLDRNRWTDDPQPAIEDPKPAKRTVLTPNRWTGWKPEHTVEVELHERTPGLSSLYAVYLDGKRIGWAHGWPRRGRDLAGWATFPGTEYPHTNDFGPHAARSRREAVEYLVEKALR
jgi:hypothetical protein